MNRTHIAALAAATIFAVSSSASAQGAPTSAQSQSAATDAATRARILAQVKGSGMSPDQIRTRLRGMGYSDDVINQLTGAAGIDSTAAIPDDVFAAARALGIMDSTT